MSRIEAGMQQLRAKVNELHNEFQLCSQKMQSEYNDGDQQLELYLNQKIHELALMQKQMYRSQQNTLDSTQMLKQSNNKLHFKTQMLAVETNSLTKLKQFNEAMYQQQNVLQTHQQRLFQEVNKQGQKQNCVFKMLHFQQQYPSSNVISIERQNKKMILRVKNNKVKREFQITYHKDEQKFILKGQSQKNQKAVSQFNFHKNINKLYDDLMQILASQTVEQ